MEQASMTFEQALTRLEEIVRQLERGEAPLEQSLALFEEGTGLERTCSGLLDQAELKVARLVKGADGAPQEVPFEPEQ